MVMAAASVAVMGAVEVAVTEATEAATVTATAVVVMDWGGMGWVVVVALAQAMAAAVRVEGNLT